jgi:two-component system LytT family response regulator
MAWRCVVIEDEKPAREKLKRLLAAHDDFELVGEAADARSAVEVIDEARPDLCFLDVRMPEGDGFDVLERIEHRPQVIFTTAFDEYAVRAFDVHSLDYLLKPFSRKRFAEALDRARAELQEPGDSSERVAALLQEIREGLKEGPASSDAAGRPERITARRGAKIVLLAPGEVRWFEAEDTLVFAHAESGRYLVDRTLSELETGLGSGFFRSHRRFLVNLSQIAEILPGDAGTYRIVMRGEEQGVVTLSRRQARRLRELFPW